MDLNGSHLIKLPLDRNRENFASGFWRWVALLADDNYERALESLYWPKGIDWTPASLKNRVTSFFGGDKPWSVVIPNERLTELINQQMKCDLSSADEGSWLMAMIPLTTEPANPKDDRIPLMGLATSFFVRVHRGSYVLELEIFHV